MGLISVTGIMLSCVSEVIGVLTNPDYVEGRLKERRGAYNDPRDPMAVMHYNAQLFVRTKQIADTRERQNAIREAYEEVCRFMRYYHGLAKKTERD